MWARVKRRTEDDLRAMAFKDVYVFRPGMIQAMHGIQSRTRLYNVLYPLIAPLIYVAKVVNPGFVTTTERIGRAMLRIAKHGRSAEVRIFVVYASRSCRFVGRSIPGSDAPFMEGSKS